MGAFYLISGNEDFSVKERANELVRALCGDPPEDNPALEVVRGDGEGDKAPQVLDRVLESLEAPPFLSSEKIVWLKHFMLFDEAFSEATSKKKPSRIDRLAAFLQAGMPPDLTLVVDGPGLDRRKSFYKIAAAACEASGGKLMWHDKADPKARGFAKMQIRRIQSLASERGKRMDDAAAAFLAETIGTDEARLSSEVDKLIAYAGDAPCVTLADCRAVASRATETLAWEYASALVERNVRKALELIPHIMESLEQSKGASRPEIAIVYAAANEFKRIASVKCEAERIGIPAHASADYFYGIAERNKQSDAPSKSPLFSMHPYRAFKTWESASRFSPVELARAFRALTAVNRAIVGSGSDARIALELLAVKIAGGAQ